MIRSVRSLFAAAVVASVLAVPAAGAQSGTADVPSPTATATANADSSGASTSDARGGPTVDRTRAGFHRAAEATVAAPVAVQRGRAGQPVALMIVGLAAMVAGAVIGGDVGTIIMAGGAITGLFGLYQYLR